jgi:hypothetical protein
MDIYGLLVLLFALLLVACLQVGVMFAAMFLIHKYAASYVPATNYGLFNFNQIEKSHLIELLRGICLTIFPPTLGLHILEFVIVGIYFRACPALISFILFALETAAIAFGLRRFLKLDPRRTAILTAISSLIYLFLYGLVIYTDLT